VNFTVHGLKSPADFRRRRAVIHEISPNILVASTQFERPFDYSTSSWVRDNDCRAKNVSKLRAVQRHYVDDNRGQRHYSDRGQRHYVDDDRGQPVNVDIGAVKGSSDQFAYFIKSVDNPPYIRFTVPGTTKTTTSTTTTTVARLPKLIREQAASPLQVADPLIAAAHNCSTVFAKWRQFVYPFNTRFLGSTSVTVRVTAARSVPPFLYS